MNLLKFDLFIENNRFMKYTKITYNGPPIKCTVKNNMPCIIFILSFLNKIKSHSRLILVLALHAVLPYNARL